MAFPQIHDARFGKRAPPTLLARLQRGTAGRLTELVSTLNVLGVLGEIDAHSRACLPAETSPSSIALTARRLRSSSLPSLRRFLADATAAAAPCRAEATLSNGPQQRN